MQKKYYISIENWGRNSFVGLTSLPTSDINEYIGSAGYGGGGDGGF